MSLTSIIILLMKLALTYMALSIIGSAIVFIICAYIFLKLTKVIFNEKNGN